MKVATALRIMEKSLELSRRSGAFQVLRFILGPLFHHMFGEEYLCGHIELYQKLIRENLVNFLGTLGQNLLDIGCGPGVLTKQLGGVGLDTTRYPQWSCGNFVLGDAHTLPFKDKSFDIVILSNLLEHVRKPEKVVMESKRICKSKIYVSFPTKYSFSLLYHYLAGKKAGEKPIFYGGLDYTTVKTLFLPEFVAAREKERILPFNPRNNFSNPEIIFRKTQL